MSKSDYFEKLKHPKWQKKRLEILESCGWRCFLCESQEDTLHVHHIYYDYGKDPWDYPNDCLIALCERCHNHEHTCKDSIEEYIKDAVRSNCILYADVVAFLKVLKRNMKSRTYRKVAWIYTLLYHKDFFELCEEVHSELSVEDEKDYPKEFIKKLNQKYQAN